MQVVSYNNRDAVQALALRGPNINLVDFDGDGRPDIVISDFLNPARILFNDPGFEFKKVVPLTSAREMATSGHGVGSGDFNGDNLTDLVLVYNNRYPARMLFGDGRGGFKDSGRGIGSLPHGTSVKATDVDRDLDILVWGESREGVGGSLWINDGHGVFKKSEQTFNPGNIAVGDIDLDGKPDLAVGPSLWLNKGSGRFDHVQNPGPHPGRTSHV